MSKSKNNSIMLKSTSDEVVSLIKKAKTDSERVITYDPQNRPEVSNLLRICSLISSKTPEEIASEISDGGAGKLKTITTELLNMYLEPIRARRNLFEKDKDHVRAILKSGIKRAREEAQKTLDQVRSAMNMDFDI
jgi:tryptophanyl-tRNA synthetase